MSHPTVKAGDLGDAPIIPIALILSGGYLAWFGVHYWRRDIRWPSDPVKSVLRGKGLPAQGTISATASETLSEVQSASGQTTTGGNVTVPANSSQRAWAVSQLASIGAPATPANIRGLQAWSNREAPWSTSPPDGAEYTHNPLNTTEQAGATGEVVGQVAIYPDWSTGIADTAKTLEGYPQITARLRSGLGLCGWSSSDFSRWSNGGYSSVC